MKKFNYIYLFGVILCGLLGYYLYLANLNKPLKGIDISRIQVGKRNIRIEDGHLSIGILDKDYRKTIGLAYLYRATLEDPLFVDSHLNGPAVAESVQKIDEVQVEFLEGLGLKDEIVPVSFLKALPATKTAHDRFLSNPNQATAQDLLDNYQQSLERYRTSLETLRGNIEKKHPVENEITFANIGSATTNRVVLSDLDLMLKNAGVLETEIKTRRGYLAGKRWKEPGREDVPEITAWDEPQKILTKENLNIPVGTANSLKGPYLVSTPCFAETKSLLYLFPLESRDAEPILLPKSATENFYQALSSSNETEKKMKEGGYLWRRAREGNTYKCNNLSYQPALFTTMIFSSKKPLLSGINTDGMNAEDVETIKKGTEAEERFFAQKYKDANLLEQLGWFYEESYQVAKNRNLSQRSELLERYLSVQNKLGNFELLLNTTFNLDNLMLRQQQGLIKKENRNFFYSMRSGYSASYLNFSKATWRLTEKPEYTISYDKAKEKISKQFRSLSQLTKEYSTELIGEWDTISEEQVIGLEE